MLTDKCFTLAGAEVAEGLLARSPLARELCHDVLDAITLHLNPVVAAEHGELQHLIHDGVLLDVLGARAWDLDPAGVERVQREHPRHGFGPRFGPLMRGHGHRVSACRAGVLVAAGFGLAPRMAPWWKEDRAAARRSGRA